MTLRIGFGLVTCQVPEWAGHTPTDEYADALASAKLVEDLGFDSIWVSEHHLAADGYLPSTTVLLAAFAAVTRRIRLGTGVVLAPLQQPLRFAEDCAVVDCISDGRLIVGLAGGWRGAEFAAFGVPANERARRTADLVATCRRAWTHRSNGAGGTDPAAITPKPPAAIPLMLGGTAPAPIARAGRLGDGYLGSPHNDLSAFRRAVELFDAAAVEAGRDPRTLSLGLHVNAWVSADGEIPPEAITAMWHQIGTYLAWHAEDRGDGASFPPVDLDRLRQRTIFGTPAGVVEQCRPWIEEFADREFHMIFRLHYPGMRLAEAEPTIRRFAAEVIPNLRKLEPRRDTENVTSRQPEGA
jgi:alkanesulfonate monooxygenase SsuD/methylene tetrahydromethanopterin reductase-like flavin-dependent oxidoreductase (luciferase family)